MAFPLHNETIGDLSDSARDMHLAVITYLENVERIRWYDQRIQACLDEDLRAILKHNRDQQMTAAAMVLEWIHRQDSVVDQELRDYLFAEKQIARH